MFDSINSICALLFFLLFVASLHFISLLLTRVCVPYCVRPNQGICFFLFNMLNILSFSEFIGFSLLAKIWISLLLELKILNSKHTWSIYSMPQKLIFNSFSIISCQLRKWNEILLYLCHCPFRPCFKLIYLFKHIFSFWKKATYETLASYQTAATCNNFLTNFNVSFLPLSPSFFILERFTPCNSQYLWLLV